MRANLESESDQPDDDVDLQDICYTVTQTAKILKIRIETCYQLVREGHLEASRIGIRQIRISRSAILRFLENGGVVPKG
jgi:excisionase family DNA binding protein